MTEDYEECEECGIVDETPNPGICDACEYCDYRNTTKTLKVSDSNLYIPEATNIVLYRR